MVVGLAPLARAADPPDCFPSPFDPAPPHPLAQAAAFSLMAELEAGHAPGIAELHRPGRGKMFGVLVVHTPQGELGALRAFSGMLAGAWRVPGFAPPVFDEAARAAVWPAGEAELVAKDVAIAALRGGVEAVRLSSEAAVLSAEQGAEVAALAAVHAERRVRRQALRASPSASNELIRGLAAQSRADGEARMDLRRRHAAARAAQAATLAAHEQRIAALVSDRTSLSNRLLAHFWDGYQLPNARGERRPLRDLFAPAEPPGGTGDCAAPKLLAEAYRLGLRPLCLAEFWWGAPPVSGGREHRRTYPVCRGKCGPIVPYMLEGLTVAPPPSFGSQPIAASEPSVVWEDDELVVVDKPAGLLSVPGRGTLRDCVVLRLSRRYPEATGPLVVHRLDLDTSGLLLVAKSAQAHARLVRQFHLRTVEKRYVAWLDGEVEGDAGVIDLALRVDLDDRPRQIHDPVHGLAAHTTYRVLERAAGRTRVAFWPRTGRTHQLRVHAAHPLGLGAAIVGDRLYGRADTRLMLHAEALAFDHPSRGTRIEAVRPAPF